jgi:hypothetical protein
MRRFVAWYIADYYHSGIGYYHPADVHAGTAPATHTVRQAVLDAAFTANPTASGTSPSATS